MFKVQTQDGERYLVQLVGPSSYRMGGQITYRGGTLTVTKRTRDYLVRKTKGAWADFDPTPEEPVEEVLPPQFGDTGGPSIDMDDIDPERNPPMSMAHAQQLAARHSEGPVRAPDSPDMADLEQRAAPAPRSEEGRGDLTSGDLQTTPPKGGQTAPKKGGVKVSTKGGASKAAESPKEAEATTVD